MKHPKREIVLVLLVASLLLAAPAWAANGSKEPQTHEMGEIVVTATRMETPRNEVAANITVITREDIEKIPGATNAAEVLQHVPGVYVEFNGGLGSQATARIQGSDIRHVAVYQDGVPLNQLANPMTDLSYLPVDTIERIEIYKGAASSSWGSSLGGVINIITKEPDRKKPFAADARVSYGEFGTLKSRGTISGTQDRFGYLLSLTHDESDGFIEHTEYKQDAVYGKVNYDLGQSSRINATYSLDQGRSADPLPNYPDFWDDVFRRREYQRVLFETSPAERLDLAVEARHHRFFSSIDDVYADRREKYFDYQEETWGGGARLSHYIPDVNRATLGFDGDWGTYDFSGYAERHGSGNWAMYANDTFSLDKVSLNAGIRYDYNDDFGSEVSPSGGVVYRFLGDDALIRAQVAKGFSAPPGAWVHDPQYGNKDLKPEIGINYQVGGEVRAFKVLAVELNLFRADIEDLIRYDSATKKYENIDKVTRQGIEGTITARFDFGLSLSFGGSSVEVRDEETDEVIKDIPSTLYTVSAAYTHEWMTHSLVGRYVDHNSSFPETRDKIFVFDYLLKVKLPLPDRFGQLSLFGAAHNLTNSSYLYRNSFPQPDRWVEGGVHFVF